METDGAVNQSKSGNANYGLQQGLFWFYMLIFSYADRCSDQAYPYLSFDALSTVTNITHGVSLPESRFPTLS
jgi:hypothetical protein